MGSTCAEEATANKGIDESVGGLVWIRRRNGSWWPGRILGRDELPKSRLVSNRSGTPVKLLGREDASIDWYNLEKSTRVKAFRCGEYDECIEKAKATATSYSKKVVKYARREDAILHALELESTRQSKDCPKTCSTKDEPSGEGGMDEPPTTVLPDEETAKELSSFEDNSNSGQELSHSGVSFEETNHISAPKEQSVLGRRRRTPNDSEDDGTEGIKRMRGLEDLGMGVVSPFKRKRSHASNVHEFVKKKDRRRQLTKVMESTVLVTVPVMYEASPAGSSILGISDSKVSGLESNESKRSFSALINNNNSDSTGENGTSSEHGNDALLISCKHKEKKEMCSMLGLPQGNSSGMLFDVPFVDDDNHLAACASQKPQVGAGGQSSQSSQVETVSLGNEEFNESGSTSSGSGHNNDISNQIEKGTSKWQSKGKRNLRRTTNKNRKHGGSKKSVDADDEWNGYLVGLEPGWSREPTAELVAPQRSLPYRQSRFTVNPKYQSSDFFPLSVHDPDDYLSDPDDYLSDPDDYLSDPDDYLYDVHMEVNAIYRGPRVPYVSLSSKLNGQPIIGHPVTVEAVDDGFCDVLLFGHGSGCYTSSCELDGDEEDGLDMVYPAGGMIPRKHQRYSPSKNSPESRKNGLLSKKIRKLSSLSGSDKRNVEDKKPVVKKLKAPPAIACVPLKLVFSRINAALN